jgi:glycosyltransferase involved in cell wall biosynthesis
MKIVIASINFAPGHVAHLRAYYHLCVACGYETILYLNEEYKKYININECVIVTDLKTVVSINPDIVLLYNVASKAIKFVRFCKSKGWKFIYVWHEPYSGWRQLVKEGSYIPRFVGACCVSLYICHQSDNVFLASSYAMNVCRKYAYKMYKKSYKFPLVFMDEAQEEASVSRKYFSYIGTFCKPHASLNFLKFVKSAIGKSIKFQIATRTNITTYLNDPVLDEMQKNGQLIVQQGRPLTTEEINRAYQNSICVWNAYARSTQSGVLANAFMLGTPVIATSVGSFPEFVKPGLTGEFVNDYKSETILNAYHKIANNLDVMQSECRKEFLKTFYYKNQVELFKKIING